MPVAKVQTKLEFGLKDALAEVCLIIAGFIITLVLLLSASPPLQTAGSPMEQSLLLGAEVGNSTEADVKVVLWLPEADKNSAASILPAGWDWKIRTVKSPQAGLSASSTRTISKSEEKSLLNWYLNFSAQVKAKAGQVYLEERMHEGIDIQRYFSQAGAEPLQWARTGATTSLSGYLPGYGDPVQAGSDSINLQVLTRMNERGGETLLALPLLLTEF